MPVHTIHDFSNDDVEAQRRSGSGDNQRNRGGVMLAPAAVAEGPGVSLVASTSSEPIPPLHDRFLPRFSMKTFTFIISVVQVVIFIIELILGATMENERSFDPRNSMAGPTVGVFDAMGAKYTPKIIEGQVWRLLTPVFLHSGLLHLFMNILFQCRFGFPLEKRWGVIRFILTYFVTGIGGNVMSAYCSRWAFSVGASGALFGLMGADMTYLAYNWSDTPDNCSECMMLVLMTFFNFLYVGGQNSVDNYAHLGGLITGALAAPVLLPAVTARSSTVERTYKWTGAFLLTAWFVLGACLIWVYEPSS